MFEELTKVKHFIEMKGMKSLQVKSIDIFRTQASICDEDLL